MSQKGFSLVEMLLSIAIIGVIVAITMPVFGSFQVNDDMRTTTGIVVQSLRRAQILSQAVAGDSSWGVKVQAGSVTIFKGNSYSGRDANFDEDFSIPSNITLGATTEIIFTKFSGEPVAGGTIALTSVNNETKNIVINSKGMVSY